MDVYLLRYVMVATCKLLYVAISTECWLIMAVETGLSMPPTTMGFQ